MSRRWVLLVLLCLAPSLARAQATLITSSGTLPATCRVGNIYYKTGTGAGFYVCSASNTWSVITGATSGTLAFGITIDGAGATITTGVKGFIRIPVAATITKVTVLSIDASATSGSIVVDVWKDTYANYPPTVADTITASAKPTLSSAVKSEDSTLSGWTKSLSAGDIVGFNVDSATTVTKVLVLLEASVP